MRALPSRLASQWPLTRDGLRVIIELSSVYERSSGSGKRRACMKVLVATKERLVYEALSRANDVGAIAALDTRRIYEAIPDVQLVIVDYMDLIPHPFSVEFIRDLLSSAPIQVCTSDEFLSSPGRYLDAKVPSRRSCDLLAKRTVAFTSYSGGTGKTSFSLDTALYFAEKTKRMLALPVAVLEFTYGDSALAALVGEVRPAVYDLIAHPEMEPFRFQGVTLYPMDYDNLRALSIEQMESFYREQMSHHVLTVIDTIWPHGLVAAIDDVVDMWFVLTTPRLDAIDNAKKLSRELSTLYGEDKVAVVVNKMAGLAATLALLGTRSDIKVGEVKQSEVFFDGRLGKQVLTHLYNSQWRDYERARRPGRGLFARRAR